LILAAGLSPAWQQIVVLDSLTVGEVNRAREVHWCASGKVLNVGLALQCLVASPPLRKGGAGGVARDQTVPPSAGRLANETNSREPATAVTLTLVGGVPGNAIRREFADLGVVSRWISSRTPTRVCTTILDRGTGQTTELVENAGAISAEELEEFRRAFLEEAARADVVVLTGSLPAGAPATFYRELLETMSGRVVLDAQGPPLMAALECRPFVVKPNREELAKTLGQTIETDADLHAAMRELCRRGAVWVVVTQGKDRVWVGSESEMFSFLPPRVEVVNPIGAGDCLAAGIAVGLARGEELPEAVKYGMAAAADNVHQLLPARVDPKRVDELKIKDGNRG